MIWEMSMGENWSCLITNGRDCENICRVLFVDFSGWRFVFGASNEIVISFVKWILCFVDHATNRGRVVSGRLVGFYSGKDRLQWGLVGWYSCMCSAATLLASVFPITSLGTMEVPLLIVLSCSFRFLSSSSHLSLLFLVALLSLKKSIIEMLCFCQDHIYLAAVVVKCNYIVFVRKKTCLKFWIFSRTWHGNEIINYMLETRYGCLCFEIQYFVNKESPYITTARSINAFYIKCTLRYYYCDGCCSNHSLINRCISKYSYLTKHSSSFA